MAGTASFLMPPLDYLPTGNRNLVFGGLLIPPGYSVAQQQEIAERVESSLRPYVEADIHKPESLRNLQPIFRFREIQKIRIRLSPSRTSWLIGSFGGGMFVGATSQDEDA